MSIAELKEITKQMPDLSDIVLREPRGHTEYETEHGECLAFSLYNDPAVAVVRAYMPKGAEIAEHIHVDIEEIGILYEGGPLILKRGGTEQEYQTGEVIKIEQNEPHTIKAASDSWMIFITIPADKGYPKDVE